MTDPIFTIGHSNRTLAEFIALLHEPGIELVVDVRRLPGSAKYPRFDEEALAAALGGIGIGLRRVAALAGRRPVSTDVEYEVNGWWRNRGFHNYADHALSEEFGQGLGQLREWGRQRRTAVMCAEAVWWCCHRRIIADHLLAHHDEVFHILGCGRVDAAQLSSGAVVRADLGVTYPAG